MGQGTPSHRTSARTSDRGHHSSRDDREITLSLSKCKQTTVGQKTRQPKLTSQRTRKNIRTNMQLTRCTIDAARLQQQPELDPPTVQVLLPPTVKQSTSSLSSTLLNASVSEKWILHASDTQLLPVQVLIEVEVVLTSPRGFVQHQSIYALLLPTRLRTLISLFFSATLRYNFSHSAPSTPMRMA